MEHPIGKVIELPDGRKVEVVEQDNCEGCVFRTDTGRRCWNGKVMQIIGECNKALRTDYKNIIYKEIKDMDTSYEKYLQEKVLLEAYGHTSVITYEEWKEIKKETK